MGNTGIWKRTPNKEAMKIGIRELKSATAGKRWAGKRVDLGKGGQKASKWTGFSHFETALTRLFPQVSTQVVDFPLLSRLRVFWLRVERGGGQWTMDNWQRMANRGNESNRTKGTNLATERSLMFAYVRLKSLMFAFFEKKYFFPALWSSRADPQRMGDSKTIAVAGQVDSTDAIWRTAELRTDDGRWLAFLQG